MATKKKTKKKTQKESIYEYLQKNSRMTKTGRKYYNTITPIEALNMFGCFRLGAVIHLLKADGVVFKKTVMIKNDYGNSFAQYQLA